MPLFQVLCRVDAFVDYCAEVDADSAIEAAAVARNTHRAVEWRRAGGHEFEAARYITLDADGEEIPETECGDI
ncbi:MAG: hypothetical protein Q8Q88_05350 [Phenylobacterium sp.]|uniref:hypothetical protein n=1 Tax=Phenylobacterium sp. TaxID=1871053 RepID=UPI002736FB1A|nr:hypothetical protein [Phenylobacterium sp.]MDP3746460.1 hypothetical protein [Phenylobacterium sp.]